MHELKAWRTTHGIHTKLSLGTKLPQHLSDTAAGCLKNPDTGD